MDSTFTIPSGPNDPPMLLQYAGPPEFDVDDVDGGFYMLDRDFGGTLSLPFTKPMDPSRPGRVTLDGLEVGHVLKQLNLGTAKPWMLGVKLAGRLTEHGTAHSLCVEGFADSNGNVMTPQDLAITTRALPAPQPEFAEHESIARRVAEEGIVLLENRGGVLPLPPGQLNIFGAALHTFRTAIVGAGKINPRYTVGLREAVRAHDRFTLNEELAEFYRNGGDAIPAPDVLSKAKSASDVAIIVISRASGENIDNSSDEGEFRLTPEEDFLLEAATGYFERTVVILNTPYPIDVGFVDRNGVDAVVLAAPGGMLGGPALTGVLDGSVNPSGRLPDTWSKAYEDIPSSRNFYDCGGGKPRYTADGEGVWIDTVYEEGIYVGYRYFATFGVDVAYPFGHGLSYTSFDMTSTGFRAPAAVTKEPRIAGTVTVTNTGQVAGREVVQVYLSKPDGVLEQPALELVEFGKTELLDPGASEKLVFDVDPANWASWDPAAASYIAPAGEYVVRVGRSSTEFTEAARFTFEKQVVIRQAEHRMLPVDPIRVLSKRDPEGTYPCGKSSGVQAGATGISSPRSVADLVMTEPSSVSAQATTFVDVLADPARARAFVDGLSAEQLARLAVCGQDGWGMEGTGVAGILAQPDGLDIPLVQVADGNSGVNVRTPNIGMPATVVLACTFDRALAREVGRVIGEEARAFDVDLILAPAMNLHRNPLNGRHPEYFSEDPFLTGALAGAYAAGLESTGVGACYKHIAANNAESSRKRNQSVIPERALRELYLRPFEIAHRIHPAVSVMTAYNALNGVATSADPELILGFLRHELGFDGFVMTDWNSNYSVDVVDMMRAGMNWITPGSRDETFTRPLIEAVRAGQLSLRQLQDNVMYLVRSVAELVKWRNSARASDPAHNGINPVIRASEALIDQPTHNDHEIAGISPHDTDENMMTDKLIPSAGTYANPVDLAYRIQDISSSQYQRNVNREAADPSAVLFRDRYYLFPSVSGGFWHSTDLAEWEFVPTPELPAYDYAPDVRVIDDHLVVCASRTDDFCPFFRTDDPLAGKWEELPGSQSFFDPNLFQDDDGRVYLYQGCSDKTPIDGVEVDRKTFAAIGTPVPIISSDIAQRGWERRGESYDPTQVETTWLSAYIPYTGPYIEGAWMTKHAGRYYLQYSAPATEANTYADGYYIGDSPLGPFQYATNSPFSLKPGGFITGAGHGAMLEDKHGNWWHFATMRISVNHSFERRIGMFPAGFDDDGVLFCNQQFADYPITIPDGPADPWLLTGQSMLLSYRRPVTASSQLAAHPPELAVDEDVRTWWVAENQDSATWLQVELADGVTVDSIQVNIAEHALAAVKPKPAEQFTLTGSERAIEFDDQPTPFLLEGSTNGEDWTTLADNRESTESRTHAFIKLDSPTQLKYVRVTGFKQPHGSVFAISGLRVFGRGAGESPSAVTPTVARSGPLDVRVSWEAADRAHGYNVRWGTSPEKLYSCWQVFDATGLDLGALNVEVDYWVGVDSFNENGVVRGKPVRVSSWQGESGTLTVSQTDGPAGGDPS